MPFATSPVKWIGPGVVLLACVIVAIVSRDNHSTTRDVFVTLSFQYFDQSSPVQGEPHRVTFSDHVGSKSATWSVALPGTWDDYAHWLKSQMTPAFELKHRDHRSIGFQRMGCGDTYSLRATLIDAGEVGEVRKVGKPGEAGNTLRVEIVFEGRPS